MKTMKRIIMILSLSVVAVIGIWFANEPVSVDAQTSRVEAVLVCGAGNSEVNGLYTQRSEYNGKPYYNLYGTPTDKNPAIVTTNAIFWAVTSNVNFWIIHTDDIQYVSYDDVVTPDLVTTWIEDIGPLPVPNVTAAN